MRCWRKWMWSSPACTTRFEQSREEMTERVLRAIENPYVRILGHPTGRLLLRREPFALDMGAVLRRAAELGLAMEHNAAPERLDLCDRDLRLAKELGCKIVMSSDSHDSRNLGKMEYGVKQLRRAWLGPGDVLNTREAEGFLAGLSALGPDEFIPGLFRLRPDPPKVTISQPKGIGDAETQFGNSWLVIHRWS